MNKIVKTFPYEFCEGCMFNGCYPWNRNPALLCTRVGGMLPSTTITKIDDNEITVPRQCLEYKPVTEEIWQRHLKDLKSEAKRKEEYKRRASKEEITSADVGSASELGL